MTKTSRFRHVFTIFATLQLATIAQMALAATTVEKYRVTGEAVSIYRNTYDDCGYSYFSLNATTSTTKNNLPPSQIAQIWLETYNYCTGYYASAYGEGDPAWYQLVVKNTRTASLKGNIPMQWYTSDGQYGGNAAIDLQWNATASPQRSSETTRYRSRYYLYTRRLSGVSAKASVSGSINFDGIPYPLDGEFDAGIANNASGEMTIRRLGGEPLQTGSQLSTGEGAKTAVDSTK